MAKLGSASSNSFSIGVAELRIGVLNKAGKLTQAESVGLIDDATATISQTTVELKGGFPRTLQASAITEQLGTVTATLREYSRRNLSILLGAGVTAAVTDTATTITADVATSATSLTVATGTGTPFAAGDVVVIYQTGKPETVSIVKLTNAAANSLTIEANSIATALVVADGVIHVYKANQIALGAVDKVNYFSASLIQQGADGRPKVWNFWKASTGGNLDYATNATDFASTKLELKILQPSIEDVAVSGGLYSQASLISAHPLGILAI